MVDAVMKLPERTRIQILAPVVRGRKGEHQKLFEKAKKSGYVRVIVDGNMYELSEEIPMDKNIKHNIDIVVDRLVVKPGIEKRLTDSLENVFELTEGNAIVDVVDGEPMNFSQNSASPDCGISVMRWNREVFRLIIRLVPVRSATDSVTRWSLMKIS